jgi:hypothetical protein
VATLPGDSLDVGGRGVISSPFLVAPWSGDEFLAIPVRAVSRSDAARVSDLVDGDTFPGLHDVGAGRVRWDDGVLLYLADPVSR